MRLYTVDRKGSLQAGQVLTLTKTDPLSLPYWKVIDLITEEDLAAHVQMLFPEGLSLHGWTYLKARHTYGTHPNFQHNVTCLTEMNLEYVRKAYYPDRPSRFQSIFACEEICEAMSFRQRFGTTDAKIFEIDGNEVIRADMSLIFLGTQNVAGSFLAHQYWSGSGGRNPFWEFIIRLPATVVGEIT